LLLNIKYNCNSTFKLSALKNNKLTINSSTIKDTVPYLKVFLQKQIVADIFFFNIFILNFIFKKKYNNENLSLKFFKSTIAFYKNKKNKFVITRGPNRHKLSKDLLTTSKYSFFIKF
jgi:hypothetical protein